MSDTSRSNPVADRRKAALEGLGALATGASDGGGFVSNYDPASAAEQDLPFLAVGPATYRAEDLRGRAFPIKWWVAHVVQVANQETGDYTSVVRVVFISADKQTLSFVSQGILQSLSLLIQTRGPGPYEPPLRVMLNESRSARKRRFYTLTPAADSAETITIDAVSSDVADQPF